MADQHVITALVKKRAELAGELKRLETLRQDVAKQVNQVDNVLRMFAYEGDPDQIAPRIKNVHLFRRGELYRAVADMLRTTRNPPSTRDIALRVARERYWDTEDHELIQRIMDSVTMARRTFEKRRASAKG